VTGFPIRSHRTYRDCPCASLPLLGAFGCGAFRNAAAVVSDLFAQAMRTFRFGDRARDQCFRSMDFAVLDRAPNQYNFKQFAWNFAYYRVTRR
jgi:uncharacterized protein (TIGR02452 family)